MGTPGRFRLGVSCVATGFTVFRVGPDSAMCTVRGRCTPDQLQGVTEADIEPGEQCDDGNAVAGDCCGTTCAFEAAGSACAGNGDLCTPGLCDGLGSCAHQNACIDQPLDGVLLRLEQQHGREALLWTAKASTAAIPPNAPLDPTQSGATLEMFAPDATPVVIPLPASGWSGNSDTGVFRFLNRAAPDGISAVRVVTLKGGRTIKIVARRTGFPLTAPLPGVGLQLVAGTVATCSFFPASSVVIDIPGTFEARGPGATTTTCDRTTLSQGVPGGELNPGLPPYNPGDPGGGWCGGGNPNQNLALLICPY